MFSKSLFKQSCKANGTMWLIITLAVCFMLSVVMLISGRGDVSETKEAIENTNAFLSAGATVASSVEASPVAFA